MSIVLPYMEYMNEMRSPEAMGICQKHCWDYAKNQGKERGEGELDEDAC